MSDNPEKAIRQMRRQLELICELEDDCLVEIGEVENDDLATLGLDDDDVVLLRQMGTSRRKEFAEIDDADAKAILE